MAKSKSSKTKTTKASPQSAPVSPAPSAASAEIPVTVMVNGQPLTITIKIDVNITVQPAGPVPREPQMEVYTASIDEADRGREVRGGMKIQCGTEYGTSTIACFQGADGTRQPVLVTAGHVVGGDSGVGKTVSINGIVIGNVSQVAGGRDAAFVKLAPDVSAVPEISNIKNGSIITPATFTKRAKAGSLVMVGAMSGRVEGTFVTDNCNVTITDTLSKLGVRSLQGLIEIDPPQGRSFGVPGDSGSPVVQTDENGKSNLVGLLVAVDQDSGKGYAEHVGGTTGLATVYNLFRTS